MRACGERNLLKGAIALHRFRSEGGNILRRAKNSRDPKPPSLMQCDGGSLNSHQSRSVFRD